MKLFSTDVRRRPESFTTSVYGFSRQRHC